MARLLCGRGQGEKAILFQMSMIDWGALPQVGISSAFNCTIPEASPRKLADRLEIWIIPTEVYGKRFQTPHETHFINSHRLFSELL